MSSSLIRFLATVLVLCAPARVSTAQDWTWVTGAAESPEQQVAYESFCKRMFDFYQERNLMIGTLVAESSLSAVPKQDVVYIGPVSAFANRDWLAPHIPTDSAIPFSFHGATLDSSNTGLYLRSADGRSVFYTGLSMSGFESTFSKPTGQHDCTILVDREIRYQGDYIDGKLTLDQLAFLPVYPTPEELAGLAPLDEAIETSPLYTAGSAPELTAKTKSAISDLVHDQRVLFIGESHWNIGVNRAFHSVLAHLLDTAEVRSVFFEFNYSFSGQWNHYVHIVDDTAAKEFRAGPLHNLVNTQSQLACLELIRLWNRANQNAQVSVGCIDMEWSHDAVMHNVVKPYMRHFDPEWEPGSMSKRALSRTLAEVSKVLDSLEEEDAVGPYPFQTPKYMQRVITNLQDTLAIADPTVDRQRGILRNLTEFHGSLLREGLIVFKGGGWHAVKNPPDDQGFWRESAYLHHEFEGTRGKVKTLQINGLGIGFDEVAEMDIGRLLPHATNYRQYVQNYQQAITTERARRGERYLIDASRVSLADKLVMRHAYSTNTDAIWLDAMDKNELARAGLAPASQPLNRYDAVIYILRSQLEPTRERK